MDAFSAFVMISVVSLSLVSSLLHQFASIHAALCFMVLRPFYISPHLAALNFIYHMSLLLQR